MASKKPNILVIWGDDIGITNLSCYSDGLMGYRTPNIDRIANEGMRFTDSYGQQSCTAGRAAFITGQSPYRTGLTKVGMPGADIGLQNEDPTIAELLKPMGYATGQFGKNHFGDRNPYLPTNHGFDEFFGNLYHLNAEEEPENIDYPPEEDFPDFHKNFRPRGVMHSWATDEDDPTETSTLGPCGQAKDRRHRPTDQESEWRPAMSILSMLPTSSSKKPMRMTNLSLFGSILPGCIFAYIRQKRSSVKLVVGNRNTMTPWSNMTNT